MTDQYTPGPWILKIHTAKFEDSSDATVAEIEPVGTYRGDIARLQSAEHIGGIGKDELIANARLIAAAPELLTALDEITHMGHDCPATFPGDDAAWEARRAVMMQNIAHAAIAKARGL